MAERELLEEPLAHWVEIHHGGDVLWRRRRRSALQLDPCPARDVPDCQLADQLGLVEAIALALRREVGQSIQRQSRFRALAGLPLDRLDRAPGGCLGGGHACSRERPELIARFDRGAVQVLTNCMVLTEGFDSQPVGCIVILRPMRHKGTFIQAVGRGLREVDPERFAGVVKTDCIVLDFAGAAARHGSIEQDVRLPEEDEATGGLAYKVCPDCAAELPLGTAVCPFCGHLWQRRIRDKRLLEAFDLTEIDLLNRSPFRSDRTPLSMLGSVSPRRDQTTQVTREGAPPIHERSSHLAYCSTLENQPPKVLGGPGLS